MKILLLTTHLRMGGVPIYVITLAGALKKLNHDTCVASAGGELVRRLERQGITHITVDIDTKSEAHPKLLVALYHLFWFIKENGIEIVHTHTRVTQVMAGALSVLTGARHVSTCHGFFKPRFGRRLFECWGRRVVAISEAVREHLVNDFKVKKSRIKVIHNGIDQEAFKKVYSDEEKKAMRKEVGLRDGPVIGIIARLSSVKGHKFLIRAMKIVTEKIRDAQLLIVGEGEEEVALKALVSQLGLGDCVVFTRTVLDTSWVHAIIDVFVLPSIQEGLGLVLLEALCCGRPVVASDVGGIYSVIKDGITGLMVPPKDPEALADAVLRLLEDREFADRLARNGQEMVRAHFTLEEVAKKVERVYQEVLTQKQ